MVGFLVQQERCLLHGHAHFSAQGQEDPHPDDLVRQNWSAPALAIFRRRVRFPDDNALHLGHRPTAGSVGPEGSGRKQPGMAPADHHRRPPAFGDFLQRYSLGRAPDSVLTDAR